ncbi:MAG: UDP-N-acetylglucosamine 2-epimerase (non-hydrolyzing) [Actinomycetota bacterium]|nr:UDP-N-acetylglucosamine 2-epimerase (non-hydrolyzing) [Actinomycetota bacterium]
MKIATIVGARPQFIKAAMVSRALASAPGAQEILIHTGQHYNEGLSQIFFTELEIPQPDFHLGIGSGRQGAQTGRMIEAIEEVLVKIDPDWVLVYGDTNSTLAGALAAVKLGIPVGHVEAGLRSFNHRMPEEINRVLTDHAADLLFAPTTTAMEQLLREGVAEERILVVGDVMFDAALYFEAKAGTKSQILNRLHIEPRGYMIATVHRAENTDNIARLQAILEGLSAFSRQENIPVIIPVHPRTQKALAGKLSSYASASSCLRLIEPIGYLDMIMLLKNARIIATDSGGLQKEAFFYRVPCVTLRDETEWVELVELGWNKLAPPKSTTAVSLALTESLNADRGRESNPYGDGQSAAKIVRKLLGKL